MVVSDRLARRNRAKILDEGTAGRFNDRACTGARRCPDRSELLPAAANPSRQRKPEAADALHADGARPAQPPGRPRTAARVG